MKIDKARRIGVFLTQENSAKFFLINFAKALDKQLV